MKTKQGAGKRIRIKSVILCTALLTLIMCTALVFCVRAEEAYVPTENIKAVTASSFVEGYEPFKAFDGIEGDANNCWHTPWGDDQEPFPHWIMAELEELKVTPVLLTGDHEEAARSIARQLGIKDVAADCMPEDKLKYIGALQQQGEDVCMIGDGINDAPALKKANVGIAMGKVGSDIAVDAADIVLVDDEIRELPHLLALARRMMTTIKLNLTFSMTLNFIAIILAMTGLMGPVVGALVHNAGSVLVILNSALLLKSSR